jgi:hypothetical protein
LLGADGRLDQLGERPNCRAVARVVAGAADRGQGLLMAAETVVEDPAQKLGDRQHESLAACVSLADRGSDQLRELGLITPQSGERERTVRDRGDPGCLRGGSQLLLVRCGVAELAEKRAHTAAIGKDERQRGQRPCLPNEFEVTRREHRPGAVVPEIKRNPAGEPEPASLLRRQCRLSTESTQCPLQDWDARRIPVGKPDRQPLEQEVGRRGRLGRRRPREGGLAHLDNAGAAGEPAGEHRCRERLQVGRSSARRVDRLEFAGSLEQEWRRVATAPGRKRDLRTQQLHPGALDLVRCPCLGGPKQGEGVVERAGFVFGLRGRQGPLRPARGFGCQRRGPLQKRGGGGQTAPFLRSLGRPLELSGDVLVEAVRRLGPVPRAPVGVGARVGRLSQRLVGPPTLIGCRRRIHRRARQRMAKPHPCVDFDQRGRFRQFERGAGNPESRDRAPQQGRIAGRFGRRQQQELLGVFRQDLESLAEAFLDSTGQRCGAGPTEAGRQLSPREPAW